MTSGCIDRRVVDVLNAMPERCRFLKGMFAWPGFTTASVEFEAAPRAGGRSTWSYWRLWRFALDGLFSFSSVPLKIWTYVGLLCASSAFIYLVITLFQKFLFGIAVPGYASLLTVLLFFNGMALISNGVLGEYVSRIFDEVKGRPLFVVSGTWGFAAEQAHAPDRRARELGAFDRAAPAPAPRQPIRHRSR